MEISAWDIYWVMQLSSIRTFVILIGFVAFVLACIGLIGGYMDDEAGAKRFGWRAIKICVPILIAGILTPSSSTVAAMVVLPAIANNKAIQGEAGDLYRLAKDALRKVVADDDSQGEIR